MQEIHKKYLQKGEGNMKRMLIVVALATALVLAMGVSPAFAKYAGYDNGSSVRPVGTGSEPCFGEPRCCAHGQRPARRLRHDNHQVRRMPLRAPWRDCASQ